MDTVIIKDGGLDRAAGYIRSGALVAVPTETVYGLAANGLDTRAVERIYEVKGRPETKPINLLVSNMEMAERFCRDIPESAYALAKTFWPGPLTMILLKKPNVPDIVTAGGDTVGVRCPNHERTLELLRLADVPLATPSANISGMASPIDAADVLGYFDGKIECLIDGGRCTIGFESTILDMTQIPFRILRQGSLPKAEIKKALGAEVVL